MEHVRKELYSIFYKHFPICDLGLWTELLQEIQAHYDNNLEPKMLIEKLQMLVYSFVSKEHKVSWLQQWNEYKVFREAKKFPK
jgi:hypothetical protein